MSLSTDQVVALTASLTPAKRTLSMVEGSGESQTDPSTVAQQRRRVDESDKEGPQAWTIVIDASVFGGGVGVEHIPDEGYNTVIFKLSSMYLTQCTHDKRAKQTIKARCVICSWLSNQIRQLPSKKFLKKVLLLDCCSYGHSAEVVSFFEGLDMDHVERLTVSDNSFCGDRDILTVLKQTAWKSLIHLDLSRNFLHHSDLRDLVSTLTGPMRHVGLQLQTLAICENACEGTFPLELVPFKKVILAGCTCGKCAPAFLEKCWRCRVVPLDPQTKQWRLCKDCFDASPGDYALRCCECDGQRCGRCIREQRCLDYPAYADGRTDTRLGWIDLVCDDDARQYRCRDECAVALRTLLPPIVGIVMQYVQFGLSGANMFDLHELPHCFNALAYGSEVSEMSERDEPLFTVTYTRVAEGDYEDVALPRFLQGLEHGRGDSHRTPTILLKHLDFTEACRGTEEVQKLLTWASHSPLLPQIQSLFVAQNHLGMRTAELVRHAGPALTRLDVSYNYMTVADLGSLATALRQAAILPHTLQALAVCGNFTTEPRPLAQNTSLRAYAEALMNGCSCGQCHVLLLDLPPPPISQREEQVEEAAPCQDCQGPRDPFISAWPWCESCEVADSAPCATRSASIRQRTSCIATSVANTYAPTAMTSRARYATRPRGAGFAALVARCVQSARVAGNSSTRRTKRAKRGARTADDRREGSSSSRGQSFILCILN